MKAAAAAGDHQLWMQRLMRDVRVMQREPLPGVQVHIDPHNLCKMCLLLTPLEGPYRGVCLHLSVSIPPTYPHAPPQISIQTPISHPDVISHPNLPSSSFICCDLLQPTTSHVSPSAVRFSIQPVHHRAYMGGYTPAYLLHYLFMQLLSFFSASLIEQDYGGYKDLHAYARLPNTDFHCAKCGFDSALLWRHARAVKNRHLQQGSKPSLQCRQAGLDLCPIPAKEDIKLHGELPAQKLPESGNHAWGDHLLMLIPDHIWLIIFDHLSDQDLINISAAGPSRARDVLCRFSVCVRRELLCFFTRKTLKEAVLGVGVKLQYSRGKPAFHVEAFDLLSLEAFEEHSVHRGICGEAFTHFLPLALDDDHFTRAMPALVEFLRDGAPFQLGCGVFPDGYLRVIPNLMNTMIVNMMKECDAHGAGSILQASEKAFKGYCLLFHLLIKLSEKGDLKTKAKQMLRLFLSSDGEARNKRNFPDLGEFVALLPLALEEEGTYDWQVLCKALVLELLTRNVLWVLRAKPALSQLSRCLHNVHPQDNMKGKINAYQVSTRQRLLDTFQASKVGLRLMMLQANFMRALVKCRSKLWERYGFPSDAMATQLVHLVKKIYALDEGCRSADDDDDGDAANISYGAPWKGFFTLLNYNPVPSDIEVEEMLRGAIEESGRKGYHGPNQGAAIRR